MAGDLTILSGRWGVYDIYLIPHALGITPAGDLLLVGVENLFCMP